MASMGPIYLHTRLGDDFAVFLRLVCEGCSVEPGIIALFSPGAFQRAQNCENRVKEAKVMISV